MLPTKPDTGTAHTPGPWAVDPCWDVLGNTNDGNGMVCQITTGGVSLQEAGANARLIAASPTLFEFVAKKASEGDADAARIIASI